MVVCGDAKALYDCLAFRVGTLKRSGAQLLPALVS
jgi:hypothetical protein